MAALAREKLRALGRDLAGLLQEGCGQAGRFLRPCRRRGALFWLDRRHEKEPERRMLRLPVHAQEAEESVVEVESPAGGAADYRGKDDAVGTKGLQLSGSP